jgi:4-amino-4-deoxy-L-arabinose transferase-like glycosyltransferase
VGLLALAGLLNLWALSQNGFANAYYSASVRSMSSSWHAFLYDSFDPSGVMTIDKPPLAVWVQALSVREFGFHPLSLLVPQALMGMASVALVYDLTRRRFGRAAGFVAGLVLATTPITVAISRHNNPDALLILFATAALWFAVRALEDGRTRWLVLAGVCVGLGFETKLSVALVVVPGIAAAWLWVAPRGRRTAVGQLLGAGAAMVAVGVAWPLLTALTPAADRPWVSGTSDNSIWSLIVGYNGLGRLGGQAGGPQLVHAPTGGGGLFGGSPGPFRLLDTSLGGQAGWLLGFAIVGGLGILVASRLRRRDPSTGWVLAVGGAFVATAVVFSAAKGIFHPYYVSLLAPFTAALVGGGAAQIVRSGWMGRLLAPVALAAGVATELVVIHNNPQKLGWLPPILILVGALACLALAAARNIRVRAAVLAVAFAALLAAPATWAVQTLGHQTSSTFPAGGPAGADAIAGPGVNHVARHVAAPARRHRRQRRHLSASERNLLVSRELRGALRYVRRHGGGTIGIRSQEQAAPAIIASGAHVAGIGGFSGAEAEMTVSSFADAVRAGSVRWVLASGHARVGSSGRVGATRVLRAVAARCPRIPRSAFVSRRNSRRAAHSVLYDCHGRVRALERYAEGV